MFTLDTTLNTKIIRSELFFIAGILCFWFVVTALSRNLGAIVMFKHISARIHANERLREDHKQMINVHVDVDIDTDIVYCCMMVSIQL